MKNPILADEVLKRGVGLSAAGGEPKKEGFSERWKPVLNSLRETEVAKI